MIVRNGAQIAGRPTIHECVCIDTRHSILGHLRHLEVCKPRQLREEQRIEIGILWRRAAVRVKQRLRFMQIVHDRRMRREVPIHDRAHLQQRNVDVAIVVVIHVLPPVRHSAAPTSTTTSGRCANCRRVGRRDNWHCRNGQRRRCFIESLEKPVDVSIATVCVCNRGDGDVHIVADLRDHRRRLGRDPIHQLHQHFARPGFPRVQSTHQVIVRLRLCDELPDLRFRFATRVGDLAEVCAILRELLHVRVGRYPHDDKLTTLVRLADRFDFDASGRRSECAIVFQLVGVIRELLWRADMIADDVFRRWNAGNNRKMVNERAAMFRILEPSFVVLLECRILLLTRIAGFGGHQLSRGNLRERGERQSEKCGRSAVHGGRRSHQSVTKEKVGSAQRLRRHPLCCSTSVRFSRARFGRRLQVCLPAPKIGVQLQISYSRAPHTPFFLLYPTGESIK